MSLQWSTLNVPLIGGLNQSVDARAMSAPSLTICKDVQFDEQGGIQTRLPFAAIATNIFGGGTLANTRRLVRNGDELLCFTVDSLYSWNATLSAWVNKGTHLAVKTTEASQFVTTGDQFDCDRAELAGTVVYCWVDTTTTYVAAIDKTTGAVLMGPTPVISGFAVPMTRPRLVALTTKIMLFGKDGPGSLICYALDPASPATALAGAATTVLVQPDFNSYYDVTRQIGADAALVVARRTTTTSYTIAKVTAALAVTASTKARTCDGPIAVSCDPTGTSAQVIRTSGTNVQGDLITISTLVDVYTAQAVGTFTTNIRQLTCAHRSTQDSGVYRCYAFWTSDPGPVLGILLIAVKSNWVSTGNTLGTQATFLEIGDVGSRAFDYNGHVYVSLLFDGASQALGTLGVGTSVQNTYFLFRDDGFLTAKLAAGRAGGTVNSVAGTYVGTVSHLPGVALVDGTTGFVWCGTERRLVPLGADSAGYSARAPRDLAFTFDSNEARRCARLGATLYISGGEILAYDGSRIVEVGFHVFPWLVVVAGNGVGAIANGTYTYKITYRWDNARGERDRSTTATDYDFLVSGGPLKTLPQSFGLGISHKVSPTLQPTVEVWRTIVNAGLDAPFYLVTSADPAATGDNGYIANAAGVLSISDNLTDVLLAKREENPENGSVLESLAPPAATIIIASHDRIFLAGVAGDPDRVWYSKQRGDGQVVSFNDFLTIPIPPEGGDITGLAFLNETLVVFRETAIYMVPGDGYDNASGGQNFGPARLAVLDRVGATSFESIAKTEHGLIFKSSKGWHILTPGWAVTYIGSPVSDYDAGDEPVAVHTLEGRHQVRILLGSRLLVLDTLVNQWAEWTLAGTNLGAAIWNGVYHYLVTGGVYAEQSTYTALTYGMDVETAWIKPNELQGQGRVRAIFALGEYRSTCKLRVRLMRDYQVVASAVAATLATLTDLAAPITTNGTSWTGTLRAVAPNGDAQNEYTFSIGFTVAGIAAFEVRDNERFDPVTAAWLPAPRNVGVWVKSQVDGLTVGALETAIGASSALVTVSSHDATPGKLLQGNASSAAAITGTFSGGIDATDYFDDDVWPPSPAVVGGPMQLEIGPTEQLVEAIKIRITAVANADGTGSPTGEAIKLTGLALEVGARPGIYRRLPAGQKA